MIQMRCKITATSRSNGESQSRTDHVTRNSDRCYVTNLKFVSFVLHIHITNYKNITYFKE